MEIRDAFAMFVELSAGAFGPLIRTADLRGLTVEGEAMESILSSATTTRRHSRERPRPELSPRETEVLLAWLLADSKAEVTEQLYIAGSTVTTYIQRVRCKYDAAGRPARTKVRLLIRALEDGLITLD